MQKIDYISLYLRLKPELLPKLYPLLQQGFEVEASLGTSIKAFLSRDFDISNDYIDNRLQTVFLNGKAVDNIDTAVLKSGSTLALSTAMPGLAGAVMRRGGYLTAMRAQISHRENREAMVAQKGRIRIKLFNLLTKELGSTFLQYGIWVPGKTLAAILKPEGKDFTNACHAAIVNGAKTEPDRVWQEEWEGKDVFLKVELV
jgi:hypothetical protein